MKVQLKLQESSGKKVSDDLDETKNKFKSLEKEVKDNREKDIAEWSIIKSSMEEYKDQMEKYKCEFSDWMRIINDTKIENNNASTYINLYNFKINILQLI